MNRPCELDPETVVPADEESAPYFDWVAEHWPDARAAVQIMSRQHEFDMERAAQPPVVNVTVVDGEGVPAFDGHIRVQTGPQRTLAYVVGPAPEQGTSPRVTTGLLKRLRHRP